MKQRGRPREFEVDEALTAALQVFWRRGYEGASLTELTDAMGITRPSLYACFGNKEGLLKAALDRYTKLRGGWMDEVVAALTARDHADSTRAIAPLRPADDAVHLDTTAMGFADQVRFIVDRARPIFSRP